jgi:hypothetical protein
VSALGVYWVGEMDGLNVDSVGKFMIMVAVPAAGVVGVIIGLLEYGLKVQAERRLLKSTRAETDTRLVSLFIEVMAKAHARGPSYLSEASAEKLITASLANVSDADSVIPRVPELLNASVVTSPVGLFEQHAAIAAIGELGNRYAVLTQPALEGLEGLRELPLVRVQAERAIARVQSPRQAD